MADREPSASTKPRRTHRAPLPVVRWLQVGALGLGVGMALAAPPAIASADDGPTTSVSAASEPAATHRAVRAARNIGTTSLASATRNAGVSPVARAEAGAMGPSRAAVVLRHRAGTVPATAATSSASTSLPVASATTTVASAVSTDPLGNVSAFLGLPGAPATSAPSLGALPLLLRLTVEDVVSGTGPTTVVNPTAVVTGLFNQVLRESPTTAEIQNYLGVMALTGVNGVVAGLYSSSQFRQQEVANYYLELLSRPATQQEISRGASELMWGTPEPLFAASIASTREFYAASSSGGGEFGPTPSATTYVNLLYRTMLGQPADTTAASIYVQNLQAGRGIRITALQFVTADPFRTVKVGEIYQVLGQTASQADIAGYVGSWFLNGGLAGIATGLLAGAINVQSIEAGQVILPDTATAANLQTLLLSSYSDNADGFVKLYGEIVGDCSDTQSAACTDPALYSLLTSGGADRGLPNSSLSLTSITAKVATLIPTQNEIDLDKSLKFPLHNSAQLETYFAGGIIQPFGNPVVTADNGTYIVDGHHRWSAIVLINPNTQVTAVDLGYVPTPQDALKQAQIGVAAVKGYLPSETVQGVNLYTVDETTFSDEVRRLIATGDDPAAVLDVFTTYLGLAGQTEAQKYDSAVDYLWGNVLRMRTLNPYIPGATSRGVMPQTDPLPVTSEKWAGGTLSYSFPTISYLG